MVALAAVESEKTLAGLLQFYDPSGSNHGWKAQFLGGTASAFGGHVAQSAGVSKIGEPTVGGRVLPGFNWIGFDAQILYGIRDYIDPASSHKLSKSAI
jgi:hypothetical protein